MKLKAKRLLAVLLCLSMLATAVGCGNSNPLSTLRHMITSGSSSTTYNNQDFDDFLDELFIESISDSTVNLHYTLKDPSAYGLEDMEPTWGTLDPADFEEGASMEGLEELYDVLTSFDYDSLTEEQQLTYDILEEYLALEMDTEGLDYYYTCLGAVSGIQSNLPVTMAEYQFYVEKDITDYITLLNTLPDYFDYIITYEQIRVDEGLGLSDFALDEVISQCEDFISETETNFLIETFNTRIDNFEGLTEAQKTDYKNQNKEAVLEVVIPAYEKLIEDVSSFKGQGLNDGGLCNFELGKEYYEYLVASYTGSDKSVEEIIDVLDEALEEAIYNMSYASYTDYDGYCLYYDEDCDFGSEDPQELLDNLKVSMLEYYPAPAEATYTIKYVAESLEDMLSPAFYMVPPVDDSKNNVIYINNGSDGASDLYSTLAHEGYPGHLYQTTYFNATNPHPVRSVFSFDGYVEGWATYVEIQSYEMVTFPSHDEALTIMNQASSHLSLAVSSRIDVGVNYEGWTVEDVESYLWDNGLNAEVGQDIYEYVIEDPANYLSYYIGCLEFMELQDYAENALGDNFDLKEFNKALLDVGPCQFDIVKKAVDAYIQEAR